MSGVFLVLPVLGFAVVVVVLATKTNPRDLRRMCRCVDALKDLVLKLAMLAALVLFAVWYIIKNWPTGGGR